MDLASALFAFLCGAAVRSLVLAIAGLALLPFCRSAAARHAVLFLAVAGMLATAVLNPLLPAIPVRILAAPAAQDPAAVPEVAVNDEPSAAPPKPSPTPRGPVTPAAALDAIYLAGLALCLARLLFGALFTRRLVRAAAPVDAGFGVPTSESTWIVVPMTAGLLRPRILLPAGWREWETPKLEAVLAHERNHIRRGDWAIAVATALNRSLYWFNPLAWWLERRLALLAEQACDDAALLALGRREIYAQALLDMASAVRSGQGRLVWEAIAMAKGKEVRMRIERILDDHRPIPRGLTRSRWMALVACTLPLVYLAASLRPAPAQSREPDRLPPAIAQLVQGRAPLTPAGAAQLEQYLAANPNNVETRTQLILYYFTAGVRQPRLEHIFWMIANHPEAREAALVSEGIAPRDSSFNTTADYQHAADLWRQQAAAHPTDEAVFVNAGRFFAQPGGDPDEAERLLLQARGLGPNSSMAALAQLYAAAILGTSGDPRFPNDNPAFGSRVRAEIENGTDGMVMMMTGVRLTSVARLPRAGETLPADTLNLAEHPLLVPIYELGARLEAQGSKLAGAQTVRSGVFTAQAPPPPALAQPPAANLPTISPAPAPVYRVEPAYPPLAAQARIQGMVTLAVSISPDGKVTNIRVLRGHPLLIQAALEAVKQWTYPPDPRAGTFEQTVAFMLPQMAPRPAQARAEAPTDAAVSPAPQRIKIGGMVQNAMLIRKVDPEYPALARQARIQGTVTLAVIIAKDGTVQNITAEEGHPLLVMAAMDAVRQWQYKPTLLNGDPVEVATTVTVPFELNQ